MPLFHDDEKQTGAAKNREQQRTKVRSLIKTKEERAYDRKRRQRELTIAATAFAVMLILIFIQLQYIGSGSVVFFALFNLNAMLLLGILFIVMRNAIKMVLERKRRVIGSRLRTRLVLAIVGMTIIPCLIMFLVTAQFVKLSVDFWFRNQIESSMDAATDMAGNMLKNTGLRLQRESENILSDVNIRRYTWGGQNVDSYFKRKSTEYNLALIGFLDQNKTERNWHPTSRVGNSWQSAKELAVWDEINEHGYKAYISGATYGDFMYGILAINGGQGGYLVLGEDMGYGFQAKLDRISSGSGEYKQLRNLKSDLKNMLYLTLSVLTALIMMAITWFAFKVAKEMTDPIMALVGATGRLAKGEENVHIEDSSSDELGILVQSFNSMASEIIQNRQELTETNGLLAQQNLVLDHQRQYVETVLDNLAAGVMSFDANWNITTANKAACGILERKLEDFLGHNIRELMTEHELGIVGDIPAALALSPHNQIQRQVVHSKSGQDLTLLVIVAALTAADNTVIGAVAVFEDITEMEKMQRTAAWQEVARRIAHEIKNPLTPIKLSAQRLEKRFAKSVEDPVFTQSTQLIVNQVEQLQAMVQEFSAFAKMPDISLKRDNPGTLLATTLALFQTGYTAIKWDIQIETLPDIEMDSAALQRAFLNLLTNAAEAIEKVAEPAVFVHAAADQKLRLIRIDIGDNGPDLLNDEERGRLFEPYFSRKKGGTGLGLTIVRSIITAHRGYVRATRLENGGTGITIELPLS
ncbi:PAS domain S-box protein [Desulfovibrio sp. OttesenSCG-928-F07]|nr:PAS domain S-box protein [Desulfovibrio sp. OttesenSCG-928-F07]